MKHLVLDNGSYSIKAGYAGNTAQPPKHYHNTIVRLKDGIIHTANEYLSHLNQYLGMVFKRPFEQGNLTQWEVERPIWDVVFEDLNIVPSETQLTLTETAYQLPQLLISTDQIVFEEYGFNEYFRCIPGALVPWTMNGSEKYEDNDENDGNEEKEKENDGNRKAVEDTKKATKNVKKSKNPISPPDFSLIIDSGFNCTWIIPMIYQNVYWKGVRKYPVGGRILNGLLKETISFRHYDVTDESILVNTIKESTCVVAKDYYSTLANSGKHSCEFVLPDFKTTTTGYILKPGQTLPLETQTLTLTDERFSVPEAFYHPEILFNSTSLNLSKIFLLTFKNLTDLVIEAIMSCPEVARPLITSNICVVGGTLKLANFTTRLRSLLTRELPMDWPVRFVKNTNDDPIETAWHGGSVLAGEDILQSVLISKQEYFEHGLNWCQRQFGFKNV